MKRSTENFNWIIESKMECEKLIRELKTIRTAWGRCDLEALTALRAMSEVAARIIREERLYRAKLDSLIKERER